MKLSRLLVGLISLLWVIVFVATLYTVVNSTRDYLRRSMESHAQDPAPSLGLSVTPTLRAFDGAQRRLTQQNFIGDEQRRSAGQVRTPTLKRADQIGARGGGTVGRVGARLADRQAQIRVTRNRLAGKHVVSRDNLGRGGQPVNVQGATTF